MGNTVIIALIVVAVAGFALGYVFALMDRTPGFTEDNPGPRTLDPGSYYPEVPS